MKRRIYIISAMLAMAIFTGCDSTGSSSTPGSHLENNTPASTELPAAGPQGAADTKPGEMGVLTGTLQSIADGVAIVTPLEGGGDIPVQVNADIQLALEVLDAEDNATETPILQPEDLAAHVGELIIVQGAYEGDTYVAGRVMVRLFEE